MNQYMDEVKERWGDTEEFRQSQERVSKLTKEDLAQIQTESDNLIKELIRHMGKDPTSEEVQNLIAQHYMNLRHFYEPNPELYRGLAEMYVSDPRFTAYFEKYSPGLVSFMRIAMLHYADVAL